MPAPNADTHHDPLALQHPRLALPAAVRGDGGVVGEEL